MVSIFGLTTEIETHVYMERLHVGIVQKKQTKLLNHVPTQFKWWL